MVRLNHIPGNRQTQARTLLLLVKPNATLAQCDELVFRYTWPIVFHLNEYTVTPAHRYGDRCVSPLGRILQNIAQEFG